MIEKEINGKTYYCFEDSDKEARRRFEKALISEESIRKMMIGLLEAVSEAELERRNAWLEIHEILPDEYNSEEGEAGYSWIAKGFVRKDSGAN